MMEQYPDDLFKSVAQNILKKKNGKPETQSIAKLAAEYINPKDVERQQFLERYQYDPAVFDNDPEAERLVKQKMGAMEGQVRDFYKQQRASGYIDPAKAKESEQKMLQDIQQQKNDAIRKASISRTIKAEKYNPEQFKQFNALSTDSQNALGQSHGKEVGATVGAAAGGLLGMIGGRKLPKNTKGILQQAGGALAGGAIGGITGGAIGSNRDEKRTGFNHEDVMKPYEIATRINNQQNFR